MAKKSGLLYLFLFDRYGTRKEAARARRSTYSVTQQAFMEGQQNQYTLFYQHNHRVHIGVV